MTIRELTAEQRAQKAACDRARYEANKERVAANSRAWYEANKERKSATDCAWCAANKERKAATDRAWRALNPIVREAERRRFFLCRDRRVLHVKIAAPFIVADGAPRGRDARRDY